MSWKGLIGDKRREIVVAAKGRQMVNIRPKLIITRIRTSVLYAVSSCPTVAVVL